MKTFTGKEERIQNNWNEIDVKYAEYRWMVSGYWRNSDLKAKEGTNWSWIVTFLIFGLWNNLNCETRLDGIVYSYMYLDQSNFSDQN